MKRTFTISLALLAIAVCACAQEQAQQGPNIEGVYILVSRQLPDGTTQQPPDIKGLLSYSNGYRNFNIIWKDSTGNKVSVSLASSYKLATDEYSETNLFHVSTNEANNEINYDVSGQTGSSPVTVTNGRIEFDFPLFDEPSIVFEGDNATATGPGFVDTWEKVK